MCGITGYINKRGPVDQETISRMTLTLKHRGPDDSGILCHDNVALGHSRLSIIDLSPNGHQPMRSMRRPIWIIYNGEFYNYEQYRNELIKKSYDFNSKTDTEVIIYLYEEYGIEEALKRINGMFSFALYDSEKKLLFLARDRLGIKPCYFSIQGDYFYWGSELKAILSHPSFNKRISYKAIADYFTYLYVPDDECIFEDVRKLRPGHYLELNTETLAMKEHQYWDLVFEPDNSITEKKALEEVDAILKDAVRLRLISDVPFGAFLSGGIDSSLIVSYMAGLMNMPVKTFSIGFYEEKYSEVKWARMVSERYGTEHHERFIEPDAMEILPQLAYHYDEPFADSSSIPTYYVSKVARENVTVILSGDGGDENFAGYIKYPAALKLKRAQRYLPLGLRNESLRRLLKYIPEVIPGTNLLNMLFYREEELYKYKMSLFRDDLLFELLKEKTSGSDNMSIYFDKVGNVDFQSKMQYVDIKTYLPMDILTKVDRASMASSLETRIPFLDYRLVEFAAKIPPIMHMKNGTTKYLLKSLLKKKYGMDDTFINRRKQGFEVPLSIWFKGKLDEFSRQNLCADSSLINRYLNRRAVEKTLNMNRNYTRDYSSQIWSLLFLEFWLREWYPGG